LAFQAAALWKLKRAENRSFPREGRSPPGAWIQQNTVAQIRITAGANKFLRIYYGKVNAFLSPKEDGGAEADESDS
jgi:hypothetical protein